MCPVQLQCVLATEKFTFSSVMAGFPYLNISIFNLQIKNGQKSTFHCKSAHACTGNKFQIANIFRSLFFFVLVYIFRKFCLILFFSHMRWFQFYRDFVKSYNSIRFDNSSIIDLSDYLCLYQIGLKNI